MYKESAHIEGHSEKVRHGLAANHAYCVLKVQQRGDKKFVTLKNPWSHYTPQYKRLEAGGERMTCPPGAKPRMSAAFGRPSLGADSALGDGEFEIELGDFTRSMSQVTLSAQPNASLILVDKIIGLIRRLAQELPPGEARTKFNAILENIHKPEPDAAWESETAFIHWAVSQCLQAKDVAGLPLYLSDNLSSLANTMHSPGASSSSTSPPKVINHAEAIQAITAIEKEMNRWGLDTAQTLLVKIATHEGSPPPANTENPYPLLFQAYIRLTEKSLSHSDLYYGWLRKIEKCWRYEQTLPEKDKPHIQQYADACLKVQAFQSVCLDQLNQTLVGPKRELFRAELHYCFALLESRSSNSQTVSSSPFNLDEITAHLETRTGVINTLPEPRTKLKHFTHQHPFVTNGTLAITALTGIALVTAGGIVASTPLLIIAAGFLALSAGIAIHQGLEFRQTRQTKQAIDRISLFSPPTESSSELATATHPAEVPSL